MPTRADIEAATPKCPRLGVHRDPNHCGERCCEPLTLSKHGRWICPNHGFVLTSEEAAVHVAPLVEA